MTPNRIAWKEYNLGVAEAAYYRTVLRNVSRTIRENNKAHTISVWQQRILVEIDDALLAWTTAAVTLVQKLDLMTEALEAKRIEVAAELMAELDKKHG